MRATCWFPVDVPVWEWPKLLQAVALISDRLHKVLPEPLTVLFRLLPKSQGCRECENHVVADLAYANLSVVAMYICHHPHRDDILMVARTNDNCLFNCHPVPFSRTFTLEGGADDLVKHVVVRLREVADFQEGKLKSAAESPRRLKEALAKM